jgi:hypothetical protein
LTGVVITALPGLADRARCVVRTAGVGTTFVDAVRALIDVDAVLIAIECKTVVAVAFVASRGVHTACVFLAIGGIRGAFVDIDAALVAVEGVALVARAFIATFGVDAARIFLAVDGVCGAFVDIDATLVAVEFVALVAGAFISTVGVEAGRILFAIDLACGAFVDIHTGVLRVVPAITFRTVTGITAVGVRADLVFAAGAFLGSALVYVGVT